MKSIICSLAILFLCITAQTINAQTILQDGFESGNWSGASWTVTTPSTATVTTERAHTGTHSARFQFNGNTDTTADSWAELRARLIQTNEFWGRMYVYVPSNYYHRNVSPNNNKFWAIYANPYTTPGFQMNLSLSAGSGGNSNLQIHRYNNGSEKPAMTVYNNFIAATDRGQWMEVMTRVKVPTSSTANDGIVQVWKNGTKIVDYTNLDMYGGTGKNYINEMYLLGWSNSGFDVTTVLFIDDVVISNSSLTTTPTLTPPTNLKVN